MPGPIILANGTQNLAAGARPQPTLCPGDGKGPTVSESCGYQSGDVVIKLYKTLPKQQDFKSTLIIGSRS